MGQESEWKNWERGHHTTATRSNGKNSQGDRRIVLARKKEKHRGTKGPVGETATDVSIIFNGKKTHRAKTKQKTGGKRGETTTHPSKRPSIRKM